MSDEQDRKTDFEQCYQDAWPTWSTWQTYAKGDLRAVTQNAWTAQDIAYMKKVMPDREIMSFSKIRRLIRFVANFEKMNRLSLRYEPVESSDVQTAGQLTACANDALARSRGYHTKSECFEQMLKTGMTLFNVATDRRHNILFEKFAYNQFVLHPGFTKRDLSDCEYGILRKHINAAEAKMFFPDAEDVIDDMAKKESPQEDGKFGNMLRMQLYGKRLLLLDEWTRRTTVRKRFWLDARTGFVRDTAGNRIEYRDTPEERMMLVESPYLDVAEDWQRTVEVTQYLNGQEVYHGVDPFGIGDFSFTPFICFFDPEEESIQHRIQSAVRGIKDAQRAFDRRTMANIRGLECVIGPGTDFEENALKDEEQAYRAGPGMPRWFNEGAISGNMYKDRPPPDLPPSWFQIAETFSKMEGDILGVDEDGLLGVNQKDQLLLGVVGKMRLGLGMVGMFDFFDNASLAHQVIGTKLMRLIQQYPADKVQRILGKPPTPQFQNREFGLYDAIPCETALTDSQRNEAYTAMMGINQTYASLNQPMPFAFEDLLEYMPIGLKDEIVQRIIARQQQAQQAQARMRQIEEAMQTAAIRQLETDTANEQVHIQERVANVAVRAANVDKTQMQTAQIAQEIGTTPKFEMLDRLIEMEKIKVQKQAALARPKAKTND